MLKLIRSHSIESQNYCYSEFEFLSVCGSCEMVCRPGEECRELDPNKDDRFERHEGFECCYGVADGGVECDSYYWD